MSTIPENTEVCTVLVNMQEYIPEDFYSFLQHTFGLWTKNGVIIPFSNITTPVHDLWHYNKNLLEIVSLPVQRNFPSFDLRVKKNYSVFVCSIYQVFGPSVRGTAKYWALIPQTLEFIYLRLELENKFYQSK